MASTLAVPIGQGDCSDDGPYTSDTEKPAIPPRANRTLSKRQSLLLENACPSDLISTTTTAPTNSPQVQTISRPVTATIKKSMSQTTVQRWAGLTRTVTDWDGLRRVCIAFFSTASPLTLSRILSYGLRMAIVMFISTHRAHRAEDRRSEFPSGLYDKRNAGLC
jgi:hypothetical protein